MTITLKDKDNTDVVYSRYRIEGAGAVYISTQHSDTDKDQLDLNSRKTGASTSSFGNRRSMIKVVDTLQVGVPNSANLVSKDMKFELNMSVPVGASKEELHQLRARIKAALDQDTLMESLCLAGQIDF